jgi:hypothetical protein
MAKRKKPPVDMQIQQFEKRLDESDELTKQLLLTLKGSASMNIQGALPLLQEMSKELKQAVSDISDIQRWKKVMDESKGTLSIKTSVLITRILAFIGAGTAIVGAFAGVTQFIDWLNK